MKEKYCAFYKCDQSVPISLTTETWNAWNLHNIITYITNWVDVKNMICSNYFNFSWTITVVLAQHRFYYLEIYTVVAKWITCMTLDDATWIIIIIMFHLRNRGMCHEVLVCKISPC